MTIPANLVGAKTKAEEIIGENFIDAPPIKVRDLLPYYGLSYSVKDFGDKYKNVAGFILPEKKMIVVNREDHPHRQSFTIAHELGHWLLHQDKLKSDPNKYAVVYRIPLGRSNPDPIEAEANAFAANLLVPENMFETCKEEDNNEIARRFCVSEELIKFRRQNIEDGGV